MPLRSAIFPTLLDESPVRVFHSPFYYNAFVETPPTDRRTVEAAVASLQERLADGDPTDAALRSHCEAILAALRAAYRVTPAAFSGETIEALRELGDLLRENDPAAPKGTPP